MVYSWESFTINSLLLEIVPRYAPLQKTLVNAGYSHGIIVINSLKMYIKLQTPNEPEPQPEPEKKENGIGDDVDLGDDDDEDLFAGKVIRYSETISEDYTCKTNSSVTIPICRRRY